MDLKATRAEVLSVNSLILDYDLYPRSSVDSQHVAYLVEALSSGSELPPVIVDAKTKKVVDGFHRCKAYLRLQGEGAKIPVELRRYSSEREMFLDTIRLNARHGKNLDRHDRVHCAIQAHKLKIAEDAVAEALHMSSQRFKDLVKERMATSKSGEEVPLKRTIEHMAGTKLTRGQEDANKKLGGMRQVFFVNQVILLIEQGLVDSSDEKLLERMGVLHEALGGFLAKK